MLTALESGIARTIEAHISKPKYVCGLSINGRCRNALRANSIHELWQLCLMTEGELLKLENIGRGSLEIIKAALDKFDMRLRDA